MPVNFAGVAVPVSVVNGRRATHNDAGFVRFRFLAVLLTVLGVPWVGVGEARAADCAPTPVTPQFEDVPCMTIVERSSVAEITLRYSYDPALVQMAILGSPQTVSFVAFRTRPSNLPTWLSTAQYEAQKVDAEGGECGLEDPAPEDILDTNLDLAGEWTLLTPTPLPVTPEQAAEGFTWDTTGMDPGTYHIFAHTDAGRYPAWTALRGGITIVDDLQDTAAVPPGLFLLDPVGLGRIPGQVYSLRGCVFAMPGSQLDVDWSRPPSPEQERVWTPAAACLPVEDELVRIPYLVPEELAGQWIQLRGTLRDPTGRETSTFTIFSPVTESCTAMPPGDHCEAFEPGDPSQFPDDRCEEASGGDDLEGCGCTGSAGPTGWPGLLGLIAFVRRRRRHGRPYPAPRKNPRATRDHFSGQAVGG